MRSIFGVALFFLLAVVADDNDPTCKADRDEYCHPGGLNLKATTALINQLWGNLAEGKAAEYAANFHPEAKYFVNGEEVEMKWQSVEFTTELFKMVKFGQTKAKGPLVLTGPTTALVTTEWAASIASTGEMINFPAWNVAMTFNDNRQVTMMKAVTDGMPWEKLLEALKPTPDFRPVMERLTTALRNQDKAGVIGAYGENYRRAVNGVSDSTPWNKEDFLTRLFSRTAWDIKVVEIKTITSNAVHMILDCNVKVTAGPLAGQAITWQDAWTTHFSPEGKILLVNSIMDSAAFATLDQALTS